MRALVIVTALLFTGCSTTPPAAVQVATAGVICALLLAVTRSRRLREEAAC